METNEGEKTKVGFLLSNDLFLTISGVCNGRSDLKRQDMFAGHPGPIGSRLYALLSSCSEDPGHSLDYFECDGDSVLYT